MKEEIRKKINERKEMIKEQKKSGDFTQGRYIEYDKGYIHACEEIIELIKERE
jgi:hypothetical protein